MEIKPPPPCPGARRPTRGIDNALAYIHRHFGEQLSLEALAQIAGLSVCRFATVFRQRMGIPPHRYICILRVRHAQALLRSGMPAANVASEAGFYDQSHLSRHFKNVCGMTPRQYLQEAGPLPEGHALPAARAAAGRYATPQALAGQ